MTDTYGGLQRNSIRPSHISRGFKSVTCPVLQALEGLTVAKKTNMDLQADTEPRDLGRIAEQVVAATKH